MPSRSYKNSRKRKSSQKHKESRGHKSRRTSRKLISTRKMWGLKPKTNSQKDILSALRKAKVPISFYMK